MSIGYTLETDIRPILRKSFKLHLFSELPCCLCCGDGTFSGCVLVWFAKRRWAHYKLVSSGMKTDVVLLACHKPTKQLTWEDTHCAAYVAGFLHTRNRPPQECNKCDFGDFWVALELMIAAKAVMHSLTKIRSLLKLPARLKICCLFQFADWVQVWSEKKNTTSNVSNTNLHWTTVEVLC